MPLGQILNMHCFLVGICVYMYIQYLQHYCRSICHVCTFSINSYLNKFIYIILKYTHIQIYELSLYAFIILTNSETKSQNYRQICIDSLIKVNVLEFENYVKYKYFNLVIKGKFLFLFYK